MGGRTAIALDQIVKTTSVKVDFKDLVERADPKRHEPELEYEFSNGRKFFRPQST